MAQRVLETDFPLMVPPNPPTMSMMAHRLLPPEGSRGGRNGSLRAAYSCEEELLPKFLDGEGRRVMNRGAGGLPEGDLGSRREVGGGWEREEGRRDLERVLLPSNSSSGCSSDTNTSSSMRSSQQGQPAPAYRPPRHRCKSDFAASIWF